MLDRLLGIEEIEAGDHRDVSSSPYYAQTFWSLLPSMMEDSVIQEIDRLVSAIKRLGTPNSLGHYSVKYGTLFEDDEVANTFEALLGTLRAAKKRNIVTFEGELLLQGVHNDVDVVLLA